MVRLKAPGTMSSTGASEFQFHMVRLKVNSKNQVVSRSQISIPYGAIKSCYAVSFSYVRSISIPYGAIKSQVTTDSCFEASLFQFHMVRLKG